MSTNLAYQKIGELSAELEDLKSRRCDGCEHWDGDERPCGKGIIIDLFPGTDHGPDADFYCKLWTPRTEASPDAAG